MTKKGARAAVPAYVTSFGAALSVFVIGGALTQRSDWTWYGQLMKPDWQPPGWLFGPVWTILFALIAIAAATAWTSAETPGTHRLLFSALLLNAILNVGWSLLFFTLERPDLALFDVLALWLSIAFLIAVFGRISRPAGLLLVPYLAWVSFATALNLEIVRLNGPF